MAGFNCPRCGFSFYEDDSGPTTCDDCGQVVNLPQKSDAVEPVVRDPQPTHTRFFVGNGPDWIDRHLAGLIFGGAAVFVLLAVLWDWLTH